MKKLLSFGVLFFLVFQWGMFVPAVFAAPLAEDGILTLADLGLEENMVMHGPYDAKSLRFDLPATWSLQPGAELELEITSFFVSDATTTAQAGNNLTGAMLEVYFNDQLQQSLPLISGERVLYRIPIDPASLISTDEAGSHKISFFLDAAIDCDLGLRQTTVIINMSSKALLRYEQIALSLDLRRLPWPMYQERAKTQDSVVLVTPASPSADELQAALTVMGAFGRMTNGHLPLTMITTDQLTKEIQDQSHLLLVGKPSAFSMLPELLLPIKADGAKFLSNELNDGDGVIQILQSPWNDAKVILVVSGDSDPAIVKAAQALSTSNLQTGVSPDYSIVALVNPYTSGGITTSDSVSLTSPDMKFSDLGYSSVTVTGLGTNWLSHQFTIPPGQTVGEDAYFDLNFSTSELIDKERSEGVIYLNDVSIGSISFSNETSNLTTTRIDLPSSVLRSGVNNLDVVLNLLPRNDCSVFAASGLWVTIYSDSLIHLPLTQLPTSVFALQDLKSYPYPFASDPALGTTTFVLAPLDYSSWSIAGKIAYDLGARIPGPVLGFEAVYDGQIEDNLRTNNLIVVGEPKGLPIVSDLKESMPAYYEKDSNIAVLESQQVIYRISDDKSLGYLQLFKSPWHEQSAILGVFGTTSDGLASAVESLLNVSKRDLLSGNFATLDGTDATVVDTRTGLGMGRLVPNLDANIDMGSPATSLEESTGVQIDNGRNKQILFTGMLGIAALIIIVGFIAFGYRKRPL